jgi:ABC-type Zn uptake system ZnuABC Zn-binding protein ZnuA
MSIRLIAKELYYAQTKVDKIKKALEEAPPKEKDAIKEELRVANAELQHIRRIMDGAKTPSPFGS